MKIEKPTTILVRRRAALGDVVMTTGIVKNLYQIHKDLCEITVETEFPIVYKNNPYIHDLRNWGECNPSDYDVVYNLDDAYELNPDNHFADSMFYRVFGKDMICLDRKHDLHASQEDQDLVDADIAEIDSPFFAVHMRQWHWSLKNIDIDIWAEIFAEVFKERTDHKIVTVGGPTDYSLEHPLIWNGNAKYTPQQLAYLLNHAKCFVGIDSGPFQIAGASNTHIIGLLTHNPPANIMPNRNFVRGWNSTAIRANVPCVGCNVRQQRPVREINCEWGDFRCNRTWDINRIADSILDQLRK
jgi:ADP-heptose:LPS heptosyltransferase